MTKLVAGLLAVPVMFTGLLLSADYAVIDVRTDEGIRVIVPVPLALARVALNFAPPEAKYIQVPEIGEYLPYAEKVVEALRDAPDGVLVSVEERDETVLVEKVGDNLEVTVKNGDELVDVTVPLDSVIDIVRAYDGMGFDTRDLIRAVGRIHGPVVHVRTGSEEVKVWVW